MNWGGACEAAVKSLRSKLIAYAEKEYGTIPDQPWADSPDNDVLRHSDTRKWYGLIFPVAREKLGVSGTGDVDILNVKCDPEMGIHMRKQDGILPAYSSMCTIFRVSSTLFLISFLFIFLIFSG